MLWFTSPLSHLPAAFGSDPTDETVVQSCGIDLRLTAVYSPSSEDVLSVRRNRTRVKSNLNLHVTTWLELMERNMQQRLQEAYLLTVNNNARLQFIDPQQQWYQFRFSEPGRHTTLYMCGYNTAHCCQSNLTVLSLDTAARRLWF